MTENEIRDIVRSEIERVNASNDARLRSTYQENIIPKTIKQRHIDGSIIISGLAANRPANADTGITAYFSTDTGRLELWDGDSWVQYIHEVDGWIETYGASWTYASTLSSPTRYTITTTIDLSAYILKGTVLKLTHNGTVKYFKVTKNSTYLLGTLTVTLVPLNGATLSATALTNVFYSQIASPVGYTAPLTIEAHVNRISSNTITNGTALPFDNDNSDVFGLHDTVTNNDRIYIPTTGIYFLAVSTRIADNATGDYIAILPRKNGAAIQDISGNDVSQYISKDASGRRSISATFNVSFTEGDYVTFELQQDSGAGRALFFAEASIRLVN